MGLESFENLEKIPEWASVENFSQPIEPIASEAEESVSDSKDSVEYFNPGLERTEIVTNLEMSEGIAKYLETVEEFRYENWTKLSLEERTEVLNRVEQKIAEIEHRPPLKVNTEEMGPRNLGYQCASEQRIALNSKIVALNTPEAHRRVLETIVHEGRHAYQHYNVDVKCIHESASVVKEWQKNFYDPKWGYYSYRGQKIYVPNSHGRLTDIGFKLYEQQPVEVDARNFASDVLARLEAKGVIRSEAEITTAKISAPSEFTALDNPFESGFDKEHSMPTFDQLRNAGFSSKVANSILYGCNHTYSQRELFHVLYESKDPVKAYNEMMNEKVSKP